METKSILELEKIVDNATDAIEYKLVIASLIAVLDKLSVSASFDLRSVLSSLKNEFNSEMSIEKARRKCKVAITTVSLALQYN